MFIIYIYIYIYIYTYIYTYTHIYTYIYVYTYIHIHIHIYIHTYIAKDSHVEIYSPVRNNLYNLQGVFNVFYSALLEHHLGIINHMIIHHLFIFLKPTFHTTLHIALTQRSSNAALLSLNVAFFNCV